MLFKAIETFCVRVDCTTISCSKGEHEEILKLMKEAEYVNNGINIEELKKLLGSVDEKNCMRAGEKRYEVFTPGPISRQRSRSCLVRLLWLHIGRKALMDW